MIEESVLRAVLLTGIKDELFVEFIDEVVNVADQIVSDVDIVHEDLDAFVGSFDVVADELDPSFAKADLLGQQLELGNGAGAILKSLCYLIAQFYL